MIKKEAQTKSLILASDEVIIKEENLLRKRGTQIEIPSRTTQW